MNIDDFNLKYEYDDCYSEEKIKLKLNLNKIDEKICNDQKKYDDNREEIDGLSSFGEDLENKQYYLFENQKLMHRINENKKMKDQPYFGRMKLESDKEEMDIYIGEKSIDDINNKAIVYDWRAPVTSLFYANQLNYKYKEYNYKVSLKRKILIKKSTLVHCNDTYSNNKKNNEITDEFLKKILLEKKSNDKFVDIIKTIQTKQNEIIREDISKNVIVEGIAGSGKTVIILHRISYLLFNNPDISESSFLFIAPNNIFKDKLSELNKKLQIDKINIKTIQEYYLSKLNMFFVNRDKNRSLEFSEIIDDNYADSEYFINKYSKNNFDNIMNYFKNLYQIKLDDVLQIKKISTYNKGECLYDNIKNIRATIKEDLDKIISMENKIKKFYKSDKLYGNELSKAELIFKYLNCDKVSFSLINIEENEDFNKIINNKIKLKLGNVEFESLLNLSINYRNLEHEIKIKEIEFCDFLVQNSLYKNDFIEGKTMSTLNKKIKSDYDKNIENLNKNKIEIEKFEKIIKKSNNKIYSFFNSKKISNAYDKKEKNCNSVNMLSERIKNFENAIKLSSQITKLNKKNEKFEKEIKALDDSVKSYHLLIDLLNVYNKFELELKKNNNNLYITINDFDNLSMNIYKYIYSAIGNDINSDVIDINDYLVKMTDQLKTIDFLKKEKLLLVIEHLDNLLNPSFIFDNYENYMKMYDKKAMNKYYIKKTKSINRADAYILLRLISEIGYVNNSNYKYVYIDESQDYNDNEIKVINCLENNPILNIYGDVGQNIYQNVHERKNFAELEKILEKKFDKYKLNENYRNTTDVVNYCNKKLDKNIIAIGNKGKKVVENKFSSIEKVISDINNLDYVVITNEENFIKRLNKEGINCYTVIQSKGLEFKNVAVIDINLDDNSRYVAYTRTLNDLIVYK